MPPVPCQDGKFVNFAPLLLLDLCPASFKNHSRCSKCHQICQLHRSVSIAVPIEEFQEWRVGTMEAQLQVQRSFILDGHCRGKHDQSLWWSRHENVHDYWANISWPDD
mmetsp:Transcript_121310/g.294312  ORF Transcript_121310/g.294312 Transcript_121310/m.294312 type:complete len:108 (+) Transcript_121310:61-384(+)